MSGVSLQKAEHAEPASEVETARYIAEMTNGMSTLARRSELDVLAYLLDLVRLEAEEVAQRGNIRQQG